MKLGIQLSVALVGMLVTALKANGQTATLKDAYKDYFLTGVAINRSHATASEGSANGFGRSREQVGNEIALVKAQFNQITSENDLKWEKIHPRAGADGYDFGPADAFVNFGLSNNMYLVGHTLVWHSQTPNWVFAGTNPPPVSATGTNAPRGGGFGRGFGFNGPRCSREELLQRMREHIHTVVGRYKGKVKVWDVVNEAIADGGTNVLRVSPWSQIIGSDFIAKAFEYAHEADPDAILRYNDYSLESPGKRKKLITLIKELQAQKVPVHAIGTQMHISSSSPSLEQMEQTFAELEQLGLPIHVTELDVNSARSGQRDTGADVAENVEATQGGLIDDANKKLADQYEKLFKVLVNHRNSVKMVTFWGVNDGVSWRANGKPLLFDANNNPKPAFDAVIIAAPKETAIP